MRKIVILSTFFVFSPFLLFLSIAFLLFLSYNRSAKSQAFAELPKTVAYAALPSIENSIAEDITQKDARVEMIRQFLHRYGSPLEPDAALIVSTADTYKLDFRLLPAIAMQESNLCLKAPAGSNNCWGFGIYGSKVKTFSSYEEGIETVTRTLAKDYKGRGLESPDEIVSRYTPSDTGKWVNSVSFFMNQLQ